MEDMLPQALAYAAKGWRVIPLHSPNAAGLCDCNHDDCKSPAKHPRTLHGLKDATTDEAQIREWWRTWPHANIGICTGSESGIIVIDIDDVAAGEQIIEQCGGVPDSPSVATGGGGRHLYYRHPGRPVSNRARVYHGMDSRGDGGYVVAPPSVHISGRRYEWLDDSQDEPLPPCPAWWLAKLSAATASHIPSTGRGSAIPEGQRNSALASFGGTLRKAGAGYETILAALQSRNDADCTPPLDDAEVSAIARSVARYRTGDEVNRQAEEFGTSLVTGLLASRQADRDEVAQTYQIPESIHAPQGLIPAHGAIREVVDYILATSILPQPVMALGAALALIATAAGRGYRSWTDLRCNLYAVALAGSGSGKDHPRKVVKKILKAAGLDDRIGGSRIASGPGLFSAMMENPTKVFILDEFGYTLQAINSPTAPSYQREIGTQLMELYSSANSVLKSAEYASKKERPVELLNEPCAILYATSTHRQFYDSIKSEQAVSGQIARLLILNAPQEIPPNNPDPSPEPVPEYITSMTQGIATAHDHGRLPDLSSCAATPYEVPPTADVRAAFTACQEEMKKLAIDDASASIYMRVAENAQKVAMLYAISCDWEDPIIAMEHWEWGLSLARWSADTLMDQYGRFSADTEMEANSKKVEEYIRKAGREGIAPSLLDRHMGRKFRDQEWKSIMENLSRTGVVILDSPKTGTVGRTKTRIVHACWMP